MQKTSLGSEDAAYPAGSLRQSHRYGTAIFPDGKVRRVKLGVADTFFSIPARAHYHGRTVSGFVSIAEDWTWNPTTRRYEDNPNAGELVFTITGKHRGA